MVGPPPTGASAVPVMFGWTEQTNVYVAGRQRRDVVDPRLDAVEDVALEDRRRRSQSLISMLCGVPASSLSKAIVNGLPAGAVHVVSTNAMPLAVDRDVGRSRRGRRAPARPTAARRRPSRSGAARAAGARVRPFGLAGGRTPGLEDGRADEQHGQRGRTAATACAAAGMFSRWPVRSASTVLRYSATASTSQPTSVDDQGDDADGQQPAAERRGRGTGARRPERARGTAGTTARACGRRAAARRGRRPAGPARSRRRRGRRSRSASRQPVEQGQDQGDDARATRIDAAEDQAEEEQERRRSRRRSARTTARACGCRPASAARPAACRGAPSARSGAAGTSRSGPDQRPGPRSPTGMSAISAPQSGVTNCAVRSRSRSRWRSSIGRVGVRRSDAAIGRVTRREPATRT